MNILLSHSDASCMLRIAHWRAYSCLQPVHCLHDTVSFYSVGLSMSPRDSATYFMVGGYWMKAWHSMFPRLL